MDHRRLEPFFKEESMDILGVLNRKQKCNAMLLIVSNGKFWVDLTTYRLVVFFMFKIQKEREKRCQSIL